MLLCMCVYFRHDKPDCSLLYPCCCRCPAQLSLSSVLPPPLSFKQQRTRDSSCVNKQSITRRRGASHYNSQPTNYLLLPCNRLIARFPQKQDELLVYTTWCEGTGCELPLHLNTNTDLHPQIPCVYSQRSFKGPLPPTPCF